VDQTKRASSLELFFDLVFVFAITQIVSLIVHDLSWSGLFHGALVLAMLWWVWGHYTWMGNSIDLDPRPVRAAILISMAVIFVMAQAVPDGVRRRRRLARHRVSDHPARGLLAVLVRDRRRRSAAGGIAGVHPGQPRRTGRDRDRSLSGRRSAMVVARRLGNRDGLGWGCRNHGLARQRRALRRTPTASS